MHFFSIIIWLLGITFNGVQSQETYRAGVVEFGVNFVSHLPDYFERNTERYVQLISEAAAQNVDIVVFPESTLNYAFTPNRSTIIQYAMEIADPDEALSPCDMEDSHWMLKSISCAARNGHLYIVINVSEKLTCDEDTQDEMNDDRLCHSDGYYLFNTNVVFNRFGVIVSRYRKTHLFGEFSFNTTSRPEIKTFDTDFGVRFGHLICFDLQYRTPAQILIEWGVKNFVLPLMWYSELPFLTAVQYESAWSQAHDANLLASGASSPLSGSGGSGIFAGGRGDRASILSGETTTRLLVADLFKEPSKGNFTDPPQMLSENPRRMNLLRDHLHLFAVRLLDPQNVTSAEAERICYLDFCCHFNIDVSFYGNSSEPPAAPHYSYALVAFRGVRTFSGVASGGIESCGLVACTSSSENDCGLRFPASIEYSPYVVFENISVTGNFTPGNSAHYPISLTGAMLPLTIDNFESDSSVVDNKRHLSVILKKNQSDLLTFGVYGRVFSMDCDPVTEVREFKHYKVLGIDSYDDCLFSSSSGDEFGYLWSKLYVALLFVCIYFLEMM